MPLPLPQNPLVPDLVLTKVGLTPDGHALVLQDDTVYTSPGRGSFAVVVMVFQRDSQGEETLIPPTGYFYPTATEFRIPLPTDGVYVYQGVIVVAQEGVTMEIGELGEVRYNLDDNLFYRNQDGEVTWLVVPEEDLATIIRPNASTEQGLLQLTDSCLTRNELVLTLLEDQLGLQDKLSPKGRDRLQEHLEVTELVITGASYLYQLGNPFQAALVVERFLPQRYTRFC